MATSDAVILFAHGSRDAAWHAPIQSVARRVSARDPALPVSCAYLELTDPDLPTACGELVARGVRRIRVLPMFLGTGRHAREDLPRLVADARRAWPEVEFVLEPAVGEHPKLLDLLAELALGEIR